MTNTETTWSVFPGTDMEGDACLYITVGPADGPRKYLTDEQAETLAPAIEELLNAGTLTVIEDEEDDDDALAQPPIDSCRKCGKAVTQEDIDDGDACTDMGEGEEAGKVFSYCSAHCRDTH